MTALAIGATVAGVGAKAIGANESADAQNAAIAAETRRQKALDAERSALFAQTLNTQTRPQQDQRLSQVTQELQQQADAGVAPPPIADVPLAGNAPQIVRDALASRMGASDQAARAEAARRAAVAAWSGLQQGNAIDLARSGQKQGMLGGFSRASSDLLPMELQVAGHAGDTWGGIGDLLGAGGQAVGLYGALNGLNGLKAPMQIGTVNQTFPRLDELPGWR
jgi:hypothetical protein